MAFMREAVVELSSEKAAGGGGEGQGGRGYKTDNIICAKARWQRESGSIRRTERKSVCLEQRQHGGILCLRGSR